MATMHKWRMKEQNKPWHQICAKCGAERWGHTSGWGRAMKNGKSVKYCEVKD